MEMYAIAIGEEWQAGPYTSRELADRTLAIIQTINPDAELVTQEMDPWSEQILAGLLPFRIHVDLADGLPQLPADVQITWPPSSIEGIQEGNQEYREYFVWSEGEKAALRRLATLNKATQQTGGQKASAGGL